jgi:hypothetical protein
MNDPHVESLLYRLKTAETLEFKDPPPLEYATDELRMSLAEGWLTVWPNDHFASEEDARATVEPYLRTWEASEAVRRFGRREMRFEFESSKVIDRDPPPPGAPQVVQVKSLEMRAELGIHIKGVLKKELCYPPPPEGFVASPEVEYMLARYEQYLKGEPLLTMAYACLTFLRYFSENAPVENAHKKVEHVYGVHKPVLDKLGNLTSVLGDYASARKVNAQSKHRPPSGKERRWIEQCVLTLIRRAGEHAADPQKNLPLIRMDDLPRLQ